MSGTAYAGARGHYPRRARANGRRPRWPLKGFSHGGEGRCCRVDRCALFVDAGYVLADGAMAVHGTRRRESVSWDYAGLLQFLAGLAAERSGLPLLRCYWYEATVEGRRGADHDALADLPGVKLRLAKMRPGRREGVEGEIHRDLATLARNKAVSDAMVVSAEEDLAGVIADVQDLGMRVTMAHITVDGNWTISRALRQECDDIAEINASHLRPYVELISGAEPAQAEDGGSGQGNLAVIGRAPTFTPAGGNGNGNGHQLPAAVYAEPVPVEYSRAVPQPSRQRPGNGARNGGPANGDEPGRRREELPAASLPPATPLPPAPSLPAAPGNEWNWSDARPAALPGQPAFDDGQRQVPAALYQPGQQPGMAPPGGPAPRQDYPMPAGPGPRQELAGPQDLYPVPGSGPMPAPVAGQVLNGMVSDRVTEMPRVPRLRGPGHRGLQPGSAPRDDAAGRAPERHRRSDTARASGTRLPGTGRRRPRPDGAGGADARRAGRPGPASPAARSRWRRPAGRSLDGRSARDRAPGPAGATPPAAAPAVAARHGAGRPDMAGTRRPTAARSRQSPAATSRNRASRHWRARRSPVRCRPVPAARCPGLAARCPGRPGQRQPTGWPR